MVSAGNKGEGWRGTGDAAEQHRFMFERGAGPPGTAVGDSNPGESERKLMQIDYPFRLDSSGGTATTDEEEHIRDLVEQVLFTAPGERVNRPDFGAGLKQLIFAPNSDELAAATESLVQGTLQRWLGELIQVESVSVEREESSLQVTVAYVIRRNQQHRTAEYQREV